MKSNIFIHNKVRDKRGAAIMGIVTITMVALVKIISVIF